MRTANVSARPRRARVAGAAWRARFTTERPSLLAGLGRAGAAAGLYTHEPACRLNALTLAQPAPSLDGAAAPAKPADIKTWTSEEDNFLRECVRAHSSLCGLWPWAVAARLYVWDVPYVPRASS